MFVLINAESCTGSLAGSRRPEKLFFIVNSLLHINICIAGVVNEEGSLELLI